MNIQTRFRLLITEKCGMNKCWCVIKCICFNIFVFHAEKKTPKASQTNILRTRNLIILKIALSQAPRSGVIENITLGEYWSKRTMSAPDTFEEVTVLQVI